MAIIDKIDKLSGTDTRSRNITQAIDKYSGKGPSKNIDDAVKKLDETGTLGKMGIKERIDHLSNAQTMSRDITQAIDRHTGKGPSKNIEEALKWWEDPTPPGPGITEAYAVFDSADGSLIFFRDEPGKYSEGQVEDTKTYYTGVETKASEFGWTSKNTNVITVSFNDDIKPISTYRWFMNCRDLTSITNIDKLDTSEVTNMSMMFANCNKLSELDVSNFNTSNVTNMSLMFADCFALTSLDLSGFNTSRVTDMSDMFGACNSITYIDVSSFNTSEVTDMSNMFNTCSSLTSIDISGFDVSKAIMMFMFKNCSSLTTDITINDISKYPASMFYNAATNPPAQITLYGEGSVTSADIDTFIASVKAISSDSNIVNGMQTDTEAYAVFDLADNSLVFFRDEPGKYSEDQEEDTKIYYTGVETKTDTFGWTSRDEHAITVSFNDTIKPISTESWFAGCTELTSIDLDKLNTSNVSNMARMFYDCESLTSLDLSGFDTSNVTNMRSMFFWCLALTSIDVSGFDISNVTNMTDMFNKCRSLTTDITINDISKYSADMFANAATISPAKITLYGEGSVTSADIDTFIASVKAISSDSNIVNGM